jgi:methionyl aminopeptidase
MEDDWLKAGRIAAEVRESSRTLIKPGTRLLDIANEIEASIRKKGAVPAFPVNLSLDETAAHYTPIADDPTILDTQVIKVDIGVSFKGAIGDTAYTVDLSGQHKGLVKASEDALKAAMKMMQPGTRLGDIGKAIHETIQSHGYTPIRNLSGHGLELNSVHNPPTIPNFDTGDRTELKPGQHVAVEPFATTGTGMIRESVNPMIYSQINARPVRSQMTRDVLKDIIEYQGLPFATRWLKHSPGKLAFALRDLVQSQNLREYPPLVEVRGGIVSQAEHTFLIGEKTVVTTKSDQI